MVIGAGRLGSALGAALRPHADVTLEAWAEALMPAERALLAPLVRATVENWAQHGAERALTGPIARGDAATVARQRAAVAAATPERLALWDELAAATVALAGVPAGTSRRVPAGTLAPSPAGAAR